MSKVRAGGESVRKFLIENMDRHPADIVRLTMEKFGCTRQAVHKHLQRLVADGTVIASGTTRSKRYVLAPLVTWEKSYATKGGLAEDVVWRQDIAVKLSELPENVLNIWHYGFTEMFNNVIDHSEATGVVVRLVRTLATTKVDIYDNGVGIFKKIQAALNLADERHAALELAKGKFTTDPANHSGEGIFFASRLFDEFRIFSGEVCFSHEFGEREDWILHKTPDDGTFVSMVLPNHTSRTPNEVFDEFTTDEDYRFSKTVVPVKLMEYGDDNLVSRSQAKRLLVRFDRFRVVILDFSDVTLIGQAFADEVFRVFTAKHPEVELIPVHASPEVQRMISRARALGASLVWGT